MRISDIIIKYVNVLLISDEFMCSGVRTPPDASSRPSGDTGIHCTVNNLSYLMFIE